MLVVVVLVVVELVVVVLLEVEVLEVEVVGTGATIEPVALGLPDFGMIIPSL